MRSQSSRAQPKCASAGPTVSDGSATRPQTTISRAGDERVGDRLGAEVGIGRDDAQAVPRAPSAAASASRCGGAAEVVAFDDRDARRAQPEFARQRVDAPRRALRVGGAEVADDADAGVAGSVPAPGAAARRAAARSRPSGSLRRASWASASVRSASVSKISTAGPPLATSASTTGAAASVRSPEKPAAQPMRRKGWVHASPCRWRRCRV